MTDQLSIAGCVTRISKSVTRIFRNAIGISWNSTDIDRSAAGILIVSHQLNIAGRVTKIFRNVRGIFRSATGIFLECNRHFHFKSVAGKKRKKLQILGIFSSWKYYTENLKQFLKYFGITS